MQSDNKPPLNPLSIFNGILQRWTEKGAKQESRQAKPNPEPNPNDRSLIENNPDELNAAANMSSFAANFTIAAYRNLHGKSTEDYEEYMKKYDEGANGQTKLKIANPDGSYSDLDGYDKFEAKLNTGLTRHVMRDVREYLVESVESMVGDVKNSSHKATKSPLTIPEMYGIIKKLGKDVHNPEAIRREAEIKVDEILQTAEVRENGFIFIPRYSVSALAGVDKGSGNVILAFSQTTEENKFMEQSDNYEAMRRGNIPISLELASVASNSVYKTAVEDGLLKEGENKMILSGSSRGAVLSSYGASQIKGDVSLVAISPFPTSKKITEQMEEGIRNKKNPELYNRQAIEIRSEKDITRHLNYIPKPLVGLALIDRAERKATREVLIKSKFDALPDMDQHGNSANAVIDYANTLKEAQEEEMRRQEEETRKAVEAKRIERMKEIRKARMSAQANAGSRYTPNAREMRGRSW